MAETLRFYPLYITYKIIGNKAVIHLYGKTDDNRTICILDDSFEPYFYVTPKTDDVKNKLEKIYVEVNNEISRVTKTEEVDKKYLGKEVKAIKVFTKLPRDIPVIREVIKDWEIINAINEYDIPFTKRYLLDRGIIPLALLNIEAEEEKAKSKVQLYKAITIEPAEGFLEEPDILAFDIETYNPLGEGINMAKNPIIMLAFYSKNFKKVVTWKKFETASKDIEFVGDEAALIMRFKELIEELKPDILTGYFSDGFDLPYIKERADKLKIQMDIGLDFSELKINRRAVLTSKITGITHLDIFKFIRKIIGGSLNTEYYDLGTVAFELIGEKKMDIDLDNLSEAWDKGQELEKYCSYNLHDAMLTYNLCMKMLPNIIELVKIVGMPIYEVNRMGFSQLVESFLLKQAPNFNEIAPNKPDYNKIRERRMNTYKGAFVFEPKPGLYKDVIVFDFRSLYPSIISSHNISPGTLKCSCCEDIGAAPLEGKEKYWFCTKRKGFIPTIIEELITRRMRIKEIMKDKSSPLLDARSNSLKLLSNAFYGYLGFYAARWYSIESARSITAYGRYYIQKVIENAQKEKFRVLYSDTDSIFLSLDGKTKKDADNFCKSINIELPELMELEYEGFYPSGIFVYAKEGPYGAKKRYALMAEDGSIKIRGFETVRRNVSIIGKEVQKKVLSMILKENKEKAFNYAREIIKKLKERKIPNEKVIIQTQLQKETSSYDAIGPHVAVARKMKEKGAEIFPGMVVSYIVTEGEARIRDRAKLPEDVAEGGYDADYYINHQVIPAVERIFNVAGYTKEDLVASKDQKKLDGFFG